MMSDTNTNNTTPAGKPLPSSVPAGYRGNTPLMLQYFATREENPGVILLMRVGDFFEAYGDDAEAIARDLNITLTGREDGGVRVQSRHIRDEGSPRDSYFDGDAGISTGVIERLAADENRVRPRPQGSFFGVCHASIAT